MSMNTEHLFSSDGGLWGSKTRYNILVQLLIDKLGLSEIVYLDYDFVCHFTLPNCWEIWILHPTFTITPDIASLATRIFNHSKGSIDERDDFLDVILDSLVLSWFLASYEYIWGPFIDTKEFNPVCVDKTYRMLFCFAPKILHDAELHWNDDLLDTIIFDNQFIDSHGLILGVGNWSIVIADTACEFTLNIGEELQFYKDFKTKDLYIRNRRTGAETKITRRKQWSNDMFKIFSHLYNSDENGVSVYRITELLRKKSILMTTDKLVEFKKNQLYTFDDLLSSIGIDPETVYTFDTNNIFTLRGEQEYKMLVGR